MTCDVGVLEEAVLLLLRVKPSVPVPSMLHMQAMLYFASLNQLVLAKAANYQPSQYGPWSESVEFVVHKLVREGKVKVRLFEGI